MLNQIGMLKEKVIVKTLDDNQTYTYFNAMELDIDNDEPVGTMILKTPYNEDNFKYWSTTESPVVVNLSLDDADHNSFIGRVEKVSLKGYSMFIYLQNAGWKFKNKVPKEFRSGLVAGQHVTDTFQAICEGWGLQFCYSIKALYDYTFAGDGYSIQSGSSTITEAPDEFKLLQNQEAIEQVANQTTGANGEIDTQTQNEDINSSAADNTNTNANNSNSNNTNSNTNTTNSSTLTNNVNGTNVDGTNTANTDTQQQTEESSEEEIKKLQDKYKEEFEKKIRNLIKGDQIYEDSDVVTAVFDYDAITIEPKVTSTNTTSSTPTTDTSSTGTTGATGTSNTANSSTNTTNTNSNNTNTGNTSSSGNTATTGAAGSSTGGNGTNYPGSGRQCPTTETITFTGSRSCCCSSSCKCTGTVTQSFYNYCPQCTAVGKLEDNPKGVAEGEITCGACDADYCICCGGCKASATSCSDGSIALIPSGTAGSGTQTTGGAGSTYIKIPDKTFWGLIKQICGATDSVFVIANNCAYLLQYKDFYNYADKFSDDINIIDKRYISKDNIKESWANTGFYNTVIIDEDIKVQYDDLVNLYGEQAYHYSMADILGSGEEADGSSTEDETLTSKTQTTNTQTTNTQTTDSTTNTEEDTEDKKDKTDEEMTVRSRAIALLAQHVRDYGMGLKFSTLYHAGITAGSFIKVDNPISISRSEDDDTTKTTVTSSASSTDKSTNDSKKTDESKIKTNENLEQYFVQGYTIKWNNKHTLQMDVELKYGPDTPEDPVNATITFSGGSSGGSGSEGNTCNLTDYGPCTNGHTHATTSHDLSCNNWAVQPDGSLGNPTADDWCQIGVAGTNYAQATANMSAAEIYMHITSTHPYDCYGDNKYSDCTTAYSAQCLNCGDMARLLKCCFDVANIPCYIIHLNNHFMCGVCIDGTWKTMDGTRKNRHKGSNDTNNCNFEAGEPTQPSGCSYC